jgi:glutamyl-tRNA synthetase
MTVRVRIAPSPTGFLHIGTARTAVFNWLFARRMGGKFILRIEDTDLERSKPEFTQDIMAGLKWLGLDWDEGPVYQTERMALYSPRIQDLLDRGLAYRAYDTPAELEAMRAAQTGRKEAPRYDNRHRNLTPEQIAAYEAEGREAVIRFKIDDNRDIAWDDLIRNTVSWKGRDLGGDMVITRRAAPSEIGAPLYNFVVVIDDIDMAISHIIRGEDHIGNTPKQILLYEAFGITPPIFGHTPLILSKEGKKLSKRDPNMVAYIQAFRDLGYTPAAIANYMALLGWSPPEPMTERFTLTEAAQHFSFDRVNKAGARFDWDKLNWLNGQILRELPIEDLLDQLLPLWTAAGYSFGAENSDAENSDAKSDRPWLLDLTQLISTSLIKLQDGVSEAKLFSEAIAPYNDDAKTVLGQETAAPLITSLITALEKTAAADDPLTPETTRPRPQRQKRRRHENPASLPHRSPPRPRPLPLLGPPQPQRLGPPALTGSSSDRPRRLTRTKAGQSPAFVLK